MSTHRTRNQLRRQSSAQTYQAQPVQNTPIKQPPTFGKGIVLPIVIDIVICVVLCIAKSAIDKNTGIILPGRTIPLLILASFLIAVFIIVSYVIRQYKFLKHTYQSIEQGMTYAANSMPEQIDFVEYPIGGQQYGQYPQYSQPQMTYPTQSVVRSSQQRSNSRSSNRVGCEVLALISITIAIFLGAAIMMSLPNGFSLSTAKMLDATITEVSVHTYTVTEMDEGDEETHTVTEYDLKYVYTFNGKTYSGEGVSDFRKNQGDTVHIFINTEKPYNSYYFGKNITLIYSGIAGIVMVFLVLILIGAFKRNPRTNRRNC